MAAQVPSTQSALPHRPVAATASAGSDDEAVPETDPSDTASLLTERLRAYKHACGYLEAYVIATAKVQKDIGKEYSKVLKAVNDPLREGHHFDQNLGGVAGLFENIRSNTHGIASSHADLEAQLRGTVLPILDNLHAEIKAKSKELEKGATKSSKAVSKARNDTQKGIEALGQYSATHSAAGGKVTPANDPFVLKQTINQRLHFQVQEENNNREELLAVQENFATFEAHIIATLQQASTTMFHCLNAQLDREKTMYGDITSTTQRVPKDFEWTRFVNRYNNVLIDPQAPPRNAATISFANQDHESTKALISGLLERKSRVALKGYDSHFYVITPSKYLHQFKTEHEHLKDPNPELSLYLPDCTISEAPNGEKFSIKGKDAHKGKLGSAVALSTELSFKAATPAEAQKWFGIIRDANGAATHTTTSEPSSPIDGAAAAATTLPTSTITSEKATPGTAPAIQHTTGATRANIAPATSTVPAQQPHQQVSGVTTATPTSVPATTTAPVTAAPTTTAPPASHPAVPQPGAIPVAAPVATSTAAAPTATGHLTEKPLGA